MVSQCIYQQVTKKITITHIDMINEENISVEVSNCQCCWFVGEFLFCETQIPDEANLKRSENIDFHQMFLKGLFLFNIFSKNQRTFPSIPSIHENKLSNR